MNDGFYCKLDAWEGSETLFDEIEEPVIEDEE